MGGLKLFGMKAAYDEIVATAVKRQHEPQRNRALADDLDTVTYLAGDILRPHGTFTHTSGHVLYVAGSVALLAVAWLMRGEMRLSLWLLLPSSVATLVMALTTGSRAIWFTGSP